MKTKTKDIIKNGLEFIVGVGSIAYIKTSEISSQFVRGNVPDMIYPITNYTGARLICPATFGTLKKPSLVAALGMAILGTTAELAQKFGLYPGTYDIRDIPMYFVGAGLAYGIDKLTYKEQNKIENIKNFSEERK